MLTIAYIGNGKSTNRYHLPFSTKLPEKITSKQSTRQVGGSLGRKIQARRIHRTSMTSTMTQRFNWSW